MTDELTRGQTEHQDAVDTAIEAMLEDILPKGLHVDWDMPHISEIRDFIEDHFNMTEAQRFRFYPWVANKDEASECDNCGLRFLNEELRPVKDLHERVEPGCPMPAGECPDCGALAYPVDADGRSEEGT